MQRKALKQVCPLIYFKAIARKDELMNSWGRSRSGRTKKSFPGRRPNYHLNSPSLNETLKSRRMGSSGKSMYLFHPSSATSLAPGPKGQVGGGDDRMKSLTTVYSQSPNRSQDRSLAGNLLPTLCLHLVRGRIRSCIPRQWDL
jgi:hypothetical protein